MSAPSPETTKYVYDFSEGDKDKKDLLGGKGANLAEMTNIGLPVPPGFIISTYADRLYDYANARVKVVRAIPRGDGAAVASQVIQPGQQPINATWTVQKIGGGYKVTNLTVAGINLVLTQTADFDSYVQKNGFDKLVTFMKSRN